MILYNVPKGKERKATMFVIENNEIKQRHGVIVNLRFCYAVGKAKREHSAIVGKDAFVQRRQAERKLSLLTLPQTVKYFAPSATKTRKPQSDELFSQFVKLFRHTNRSKQINVKPRQNIADVSPRELITLPSQKGMK